MLDGHVKRAGDFLARYGGEEFVTLLTKTDLAGACALAEACRAAIDALQGDLAAFGDTRILHDDTTFLCARLTEADTAGVGQS